MAEPRFREVRHAFLLRSAQRRQGTDSPAHLALVHPKPEKLRKVRGAHWRLALFTSEERSRLQAALRHARVLFGTWACAADAMRVPQRTLEYAARGAGRVTAALAIRLAKTLAVPVDTLYGPPRAAGVCLHCGRGPT